MSLFALERADREQMVRTRSDSHFLFLSSEYRYFNLYVMSTRDIITDASKWKPGT